MFLSSIWYGTYHTSAPDICTILQETYQIFDMAR